MPYLAPAGTPISALTYVAALRDGLRRGDTVRQLRTALAGHSGHQHCWLLSTGRAAMVVALRALQEVTNNPERNEVLIAGYTCYSVPASVLKAGLRPRLCDVEPRTLNFDMQRLKEFDFSKVLAVVTANLCGIPNALAEIENIAREAGVLMLDDAAQSLGAYHQNRPAGGFGDIGLYSFDKGKNITSLEGGALVASDPRLVQALQRQYDALAGTPASRSAMVLAKLAAYSLLLHPLPYALVQKLPFLGLGKTLYDDTYPILRYSPALAGFAQRLLGQLPALGKIRRGNAAALMAAIPSSAALDHVELLPNVEPGYTRLPVLVRNPLRRGRLLAALDRAGFGATGLYPRALPDVPEVRLHLPQSDLDMPGARSIADRIVTLPVHPYCPPGYAEAIADAVTAVP